MFIIRLIMTSLQRMLIVSRFLSERKACKGNVPDPQCNQRMNQWLSPKAAILASGCQCDLGLSNTILRKQAGLSQML